MWNKPSFEASHGIEDVFNVKLYPSWGRKQSTKFFVAIRKVSSPLADTSIFRTIPAKLFFVHCVFSSGYELTFILIGQFCKIDVNFDQYLKPSKSHMWLFQAPSSIESKLVRCKKDEPTIHCKLTSAKKEQMVVSGYWISSISQPCEISNMKRHFDRLIKIIQNPIL